MSGLTWHPFAAVALLLWGLWGYFGKVASGGMSPRRLVFFSLLGYALVLPLVGLWCGREGMKPEPLRPALLALLTGVLSGLAYISYYMAIGRGEASRIVVVTALYPVITCLLSFALLHEALSPAKVAGIVLCVVGVVLVEM